MILMRHLVAFTAICVAIPAQARSVHFMIPAGPLASALPLFSRATGVQILADPAVLSERRTKGVRGKMADAKAMEALLRGTGLEFRRRGDMMLIYPARLSARRRPSAAVPTRPKPSVPEAAKAVADLVVIGQRFADGRALAAKREARNIVDAIAADEARRLPDNTVVDAMRRIPGVSVVPVADNEHPRDVPIAPVVRGLTQAYNNVTINGLPIASTGIPDAGSNSASRGARLDLLPTSLVSRLMVVKTFTPEFDSNAIGATIDIQTRSAFDNGGAPYLSVEGGGSNPSDYGEVQSQAALGVRMSTTASQTFGSDHQFGLVVSANYQQMENSSNVHATSDSSFLDFYDADGHLVRDGSMGNGIPVPQQSKNWYNSSNRRHMGAAMRLEANLTDLRLSALLADYHMRDGYIRNENVIDPEGVDVIDQTITSGRFGSASVQIGYRGGETRSETRLAQFTADWDVGADDIMSFRGTSSRATMREQYDMVKFTAGMNEAGSAVGDAALGFTYDSSRLQFSFDVPQAAYYDMSHYAADYWRHRNRRVTSFVDAMQLDWKRGQAESGAGDGWGFAAGLGWKRTGYAYAYRNEAYETSDRGLTLDQAGYISDALLPYNGNGLKLVAIDPVRAWAMFRTNQSSITATDTGDDDIRDDFTHSENMWGAYAMARFADGPLELVAGLRAERTGVETHGNVEVGDVWQTSRKASRYAEFLPSLLANYAMLPAVKLRGGYSRTIGRPSYESYAPRSSIQFRDDDDIGDPDAAGVSIRVGNSDIRPRLSDNFDISLEWTLPRRVDGMISAALFHKKIRNEIFDATTIGYEYNGVYYRNARVTTPTNATGAHISGLELSAIVGSLGMVAPMLSGFGFSANWTLLQGAVTVPTSEGPTRTITGLVGQPDRIANLALFYTRKGFEIRAAVNNTSKALRSIAPDTVYQDVYWAPRQQLDLQARYGFGMGLSAILDLANVTRSRLTSLTGPGAAWLKDSYSVPRVVSLSLNWRIGG